MARKPTASSFGSPDDFEFLTRWCTQLIPSALDGTIPRGWFCSAYGEACLASTSTFDTAGRTAGRDDNFWGWFCSRSPRPPESMFSIYVSCSFPAGHVYVLYVLSRVVRLRPCVAGTRQTSGRTRRAIACKEKKSRTVIIVMISDSRQAILKYTWHDLSVAAPEIGAVLWGEDKETSKSRKCFAPMLMNIFSDFWDFFWVTLFFDSQIWRTE